jgi:hypothetical protein
MSSALRLFTRAFATRTQKVSTGLPKRFSQQSHHQVSAPAASVRPQREGVHRFPGLDRGTQAALSSASAASRRQPRGRGISSTARSQQQAASGRQGAHLKKDGTPDMRFKDSVPLKSDGTPDRRFNAADTVSAASPSQRSGGRPLKADGTPDRRFAVNKRQSGSGKAASSARQATGRGSRGPSMA